MESFVSGGVERVSLTLLTELKKQGHEIEIFVQAAEGEYFDAYAECFDITVFPDFSRYNLFKTIFWMKKVSSNFDVVLLTKGGLAKFTIASVTKKIAVQHVPVTLPGKARLYSLIRKYGMSFFYRFVDAVVCVSDGIRLDLINQSVVPKGKVITIYNPVILNEIIDFRNSINSTKLREPSQQLNFVAVGRCCYQKGYDYLLEICSKLHKNQVDFVVHIVGDGENLSELISMCSALGLNDKIKFLGYQSSPFKYMASADAILLTSRWEGLPTVLVEAAYLGCQIISFDCDFGPRELTEEGKKGFLVPEGDIESFCNAVERFSLGERKEHVNLSAFSVEQSARNYIELFERQVNES
nr:glycosyltransferase [Vibrio metschnikovii]